MSSNKNPITKDKMIRIRVDSEIVDKLEQLALQQNTSISEVVRSSIHHQFNKSKEKQSMNKYLQFKLIGFDNVTLADNKGYSFSKHPLYKTLTINDDLKSLTLELNEDTDINKNWDIITTFLNHVCFNLLIKTDVNINQPVRILELIKDDDQIQINDHVHIRDEVLITRNYPADAIYDRIILAETAFDKHFLLYERIFKTLHNTNKIVQFMSLYQFMMELLAENDFMIQKNITSYLLNNREKYPFVSFHPTKKKTKTAFDEDIFTYLRNEIGHCEKTNDLKLYAELGSGITDSIIRNMLIVLNDIILNLK